MKRIIKSAKSEPTEYFIHINFNEAAADRDSSISSTSNIIPVEAYSDEEAYRYAMLYATDLEDFDELDREYPNIEPLEFLNNQDVSSGAPFVYGIEAYDRGLIFDFDFDRWNDEYYNPDVEDDDDYSDYDYNDDDFNDENSDVDYVQFYYDTDKGKFVGMGEIVMGEGNTFEEAIKNAKADASHINNFDYEAVYIDESNLSRVRFDNNVDLTKYTEPGDLGEFKVYWRFADEI